MMAVVRCAPVGFRLAQDGVTHRDYWVTYLLETSVPYGTANGLLNETSYPHAATGDGPYTIGQHSGLPQIGDSFTYGNDTDPWAICHPDRRVKQKQMDGVTWEVEILFSTRPMKRCMTNDWGNPLLEPQKVSGGSVAGTIEATQDRLGNLFISSSHEPFRGPQVEFASCHSQLRIEQNVSTLQLELCTSLMNHLNDDTLWGLSARRIKLSSWSWVENWYDVCSYYYTRSFVFEIKNNTDDLWDREILDEGTRVLNGHWRVPTDDCDLDLWIQDEVDCYTGTATNPDPQNPQHFIRYKDKNDENSRVILNGAGQPAFTSTSTYISPGAGYGTSNTGEAAKIGFEYYPEDDFNKLGIPTDIDFGTATPD